MCNKELLDNLKFFSFQKRILEKMLILGFEEISMKKKSELIATIRFLLFFI